MSTKTDYDSEEWKSISAAPVAAGLMIILSDARDPVGVANAMTVGNAITQSARGDLPDFVKSLVETVTRRAGGPELPEIPANDRRQAKNVLIATMSTAVRTVERKSPAEVEAYKVWLAVVAANVSRASKQSGLSGFIDAPLSFDEKEALEQLASVLAVRWRDRVELSATPAASRFLRGRHPSSGFASSVLAATAAGHR